MLSPEESFKHIVVRHHKNGIHELIFIQANSESIEEWYAYQVFLNTTTMSDQIIYQLFDFRAGTMPLSGGLQKTRQIVAEFPNMPRHRAAIIYSSRESMLVKTASTLLNVIPGHDRLTIRYFTENEYDLAVEWLNDQP
jgi:hypothetical protein